MLSYKYLRAALKNDTFLVRIAIVHVRVKQ